MPEAASPTPADAFAVRRSGRAVERVRMRSGVLDLLLSEPGLEVLEGTLHGGERLTLVPAEPGAGGIEAWYLLAGELVDTAGGRRFRRGELVHAAALQDEVILAAEGEVRYLYLSTQPFFHQLSHEMRRLMELAVEVEVTDGYTSEHCLRLQRLAFATGRELGMEAHRLHVLDYGAYLHDVGKVRVPVEILQKPGKLDEREWAVIRQHPTYGRQLVEATFLDRAGLVIEQHHERLDGSGYPFGLARDEILPEAIIIAIADTFDAMTTDRSYRKALPASEALAELDRYGDLHWPRDFVRAFRAALPSVERSSVAPPSPQSAHA